MFHKYHELFLLPKKQSNPDQFLRHCKKRSWFPAGQAAGSLCSCINRDSGTREGMVRK